ncbi:MAG TPA: aminopeptidase P family protein [Ohtaekwangia sp.]
MKSLITCLFVMATSIVFAQDTDTPADFLTKDFHNDRRQKLREKLPANSVAVFFANPVRNRANDVDYIYHQSPDFYYLTGYKEPHAVLLIFKNKQTSANGSQYDEIIFVQPRNMIKELWNGRRLGDVQTKEMLGLEQSFNNTEFKKYNVDFKKFDQVLFFDFQNDVRDVPADSSDLYDLIEQFKAKVNYPSSAQAMAVNREPKKNNLNTTELNNIMDNLRGVKTKEEIALIRKAVAISCIGQNEVMKALNPGMSEREVQGIHEYVFKKYQAEELGYPSIVGSGHNGCILHYIENYKPTINTKDLILMDLGAEYHGYSADVTRTIPISGKFSPEQKAIYDLVLNAQQAAIDMCKPGVTMAEMDKKARGIINKGLKDLGIIASENDQHLFFPHGLGHPIGLDVHDKGKTYKSLQENMVVTIEPGIYIPENSKCDKKWWGIAVRIEDDILITASGYENLSALAPRKTEDIETMMKQPSPLDNFTLPSLD